MVVASVRKLVPKGVTSSSLDFELTLGLPKEAIVFNLWHHSGASGAHFTRILGHWWRASCVERLFEVRLWSSTVEATRNVAEGRRNLEITSSPFM